MQRRHSPLGQSNSILLYGFGLALTISLVFNGFLLFRQTHRVSLYEYEAGTSVNPVNSEVWQQQLSDCQQANKLKDSVIYHLEQLYTALPGETAITRQTASK